MANTCVKPSRVVFISFKSIQSICIRGIIVTNRSTIPSAISFKFLPYQLVCSVLDYNGIDG